MNEHERVLCELAEEIVVDEAEKAAAAFDA